MNSFNKIRVYMKKKICLMKKVQTLIGKLFKKMKFLDSETIYYINQKNTTMTKY